LSSVLKALKKAEKEKNKASAPVINSFLKRTEKKKLTYSFIRTGLFGALALSFLCSIFYLYHFNNKKTDKAKKINSGIYFKQEKSKTKPPKFANKKPDLQKSNTPKRKLTDVSINQIQAKIDRQSPKTETENIPAPSLLPEPAPEEKTAKFDNEVATEQTLKPEIQLNMISWTHDPNERVTIINNSPMKEGDVRDGIKVLKINIKNVHILHNNVKKVIKFKK
jgi:hypothetical protein